MKTGLKAMLGAGLVALLLQPGLTLAQKGQKGQPPNQPTELLALFRDNWDASTQTYGDKIHSDGFGPYYTVRNPDRTYDSVVQLGLEGQLGIRILKNRKVFFEFDDPVRPAPLDANGQVTCREYGGDAFSDPPPSFLTGVPDNDSFYFHTLGTMTWTGTSWTYDFGPFDFRTMAVGGSALVRGYFVFYTAADFGAYNVMPNYQLWSDDPPLAGPVVQVTHPSADMWVVEPQPAPQLPSDPPYRGLGLNEAGFKITASPIKKVHEGGNCDLGDWVMPFQITLYKQ